MLEIRSVTRKFGSQLALNQITLNLETARTHILLGSSGSGKSTLLRAILGLIRCDEGEIRMDGESVTAMSTGERAARIGYVPQDGGLFPHLSARENITLVARSRGWDRVRIEKRIQELRDLVPLESVLLARRPSQLSGGQKQRVALLRALFLNPEILVLDEPFAALDPLVRAEIQSEMKGLFARLGKTVIFVTHDVGEADYLGDQIILMHQGRVVQQGSLNELRDRPADSFVTRFLRAQRFYSAGSDA